MFHWNELQIGGCLVVGIRAAEADETCVSTGSSEPALAVYAIRTKILCIDPY